jgi:hypothetical protein
MVHVRCLCLLLCVGAVTPPALGQALLTWHWSNPQPHGNDIVDMAWNEVLGVQVCESGQVYTSPNLYDWFAQNSNLTNDLQAVTYFGNRIVIVGAEGATCYSDDGVNFTSSSLNTSNWLVGVAASPTQVVAVGDNAVVYTSSDGATWRQRASPPNVYPNWLTSVAWGAGTFVTVGEQGYIANSGDGIHWTNHSILQSYGNLEHVTWINAATNGFPFTGFWTVSDAGHALYSTNQGVSWHPFNTLGLFQPSTNVLYTATADPASGLLAGDGEVRLGSTVSNTIVWPTQIGLSLLSVPAWTYFTSLWGTNGAYELAGYDGMQIESSVTNGNYTWTELHQTPRDWLWQVTLAGNLYVAVGDNVRIVTSDNGADWTVEAVPLTNSVSLTNTAFFCVGGTSNLVVAAGTRGSLAISPNIIVPVLVTNTDGSVFTNYVGSLGVAWYSLPAPTTNDLAGVCTTINGFCLVGGNGTLLNSADGTNWAQISVPTTNYLSGIANSTNGQWVITGDQGTILTSADGTNWSKVTSGTTNWLYRLRCLDGLLLAVGENGTMLSSVNGTSWQAVPSGVTNFLNDAIMVGNTCFVIGTHGLVLATTNFSTWTNVGTITTKSLYGAATQNGQLVVVGFEGSILRSQVVPVTTPVSFVSYSQSSGYNLFSVAGVVDQKFTLDSSTNMLNWTTGPLLDLIYGDGTLLFYQSVPTNAPTQYYRCTLVP